VRLQRPVTLSAQRTVFVLAKHLSDPHWCADVETGVIILTENESARDEHAYGRQAGVQQCGYAPPLSKGLPVAQVDRCRTKHLCRIAISQTPECPDTAGSAVAYRLHRVESLHHSYVRSDSTQPVHIGSTDSWAALRCEMTDRHVWLHMNTPMHLCLKQVQLQRGSPLALLAAVMSHRERTSNGPVRRQRRAQSG